MDGAEIEVRVTHQTAAKRFVKSMMVFFLRGLKINKTTRQRKTTTILFHVLKMIIFMMFFMDPSREKFVKKLQKIR